MTVRFVLGLGLLLRPPSAEARVVVAEDASAVEVWAAEKLSDLLPDSEVGLRLSHRRDDDSPDAPRPDFQSQQIAVGHGAAVALGLDPEALTPLGDDAFLLVSGPSRGLPAGSVVIASSAQSARGTMNGAFAFLRQVGFEFLAQDETVWPTGAPVLPPGLDISYDPPFENREMAAVPTAGPGGKRGRPTNSSIPGQDLIRLPTNLSAALGFDGHMAYAPVGGTVGPGNPPGFTASAYNLMVPSGSVSACGPAGGDQNSAKKYLPCPAVAAEHPEWFACLRKDPDGPNPAGNHINHNYTAWPCPASGPNSVAQDGHAGNSQPCWGNASLIQTWTANIRALIKQYPDLRTFNLGGMDGSAVRIQCPSDEPFVAAANSTGGANFHAANTIAAALADDYPNVRILIDAYSMTQFPPKAGYKFHPNVIVRVCLTSEMGYGEEHGVPKELPLTDPQNADWLLRLKRWTDAADTVYIWDYTQHGRYVATPFPNYFVVAEDFKTFHQFGVKGWFAESVCCHPREDLVELKVYLWGRLAFDPTLNATALTEGFLRGFYSAGAAPHMMQYLQLMDKAMRAHGGGLPGTPRAWPSNSAEKRKADKWAWGPYAACFDNATVLDAATALSRAATATASAAPKNGVRVAQAQSALQFVAFYRWAELKAFATQSGRPWPFHTDLSTEFDAFVAAMNVSGPGGSPITATPAALAPDGTANPGGQVTFAQLRMQILP
jgi:hypothetical protein